MAPTRALLAAAAACAAMAAAAAAHAHDSAFSKASNESLLWGAYRPNLYFGLRARTPQSILTALLWARVDDYASVQDGVRYTCEQHAGMAGYGWDAYDPRSGGVQVVHDKGNGIDIETSFVKFDRGTGGWGARIKGTPRDDAESRDGGSGSGPESIRTALWFAVGAEGLGSVEALDSGDALDHGYAGDVVLGGQAQGLGEFQITITQPKSNSHPVHGHPSYQAKPLDHTFVHSTQVPEEALWQAKAILFRSMKSSIDAYVEQYTQEKMPPPWQTYTIPNNPGRGNMHLVQKVFQGPFEFDILFTPSSAATPATSDDLTKTIHHVLQQFDDKYLDVHKPLAPFSDGKWLPFSKSLFSNLIGGIGYFYGDQVIDRSYADEYEEQNEAFWHEAEEARARNQHKPEGPYELFTSIPSRPFFPRGFLWDEGFHLLPILDWDAELVMQIISSWFNTMDEDGWIPREQILGDEARSKVPPEFQVQYPHYANPPTLYIALEALVDKIDGKNGSGAPLESTFGDVGGHKLASPESVKTWLKELYPLLQRNFEWYRKTQWGDVTSYDREAFSSKEAYRWRGRTPRHTLTSGLDDYPRAQPPHPGELHVDLISWMGLLSRNLARIAGYLDEKDDEGQYARIVEAIRRNIDDLHWDEEQKAYCDATVDAYEESVHVCHKGYLSVFPFMAGLLDGEHAHLKDVLDLLADEDELWSPYGIRSLSKKDPLYGTDENYWRSPVWMNMNYLIVKELYNIAQQTGPQRQRAARMYSALRTNVVETVYKSWSDTGFAWEQYNPETGAGQRTQHFTGWTSLVVKIMAMPDMVGGGEEEGGHDEL